MIPKIIHYCWFSGKPMPEEYSTYIEGWKRLLPDYEFRLWNETNFDVNMVPFTEQVASVKKWGFIVDYIRAWAVYTYGGIYLDTDVELLKPLDGFLHNTCFSGFENEKFIAPGLVFAGEKGCAIAKELMDFYASYNFIKENGELNLTPSPKIFTNMLLKYGLKQNNTYQELGIFTAYPFEYFCAKDFKTGFITASENTCAIHHFAMSWMSEIWHFMVNRQRRIFDKYGKNLFSRTVVFSLNFCTRLKRTGIKSTVKYILNRLRKKTMY
jgi:hypothetical protein